MMGTVKHSVFFYILIFGVHFTQAALAETPSESPPPQPQAGGSEGEEEIVDLNALEEESGPAKADGIPEEPLLPVALSPVELEKKTYLRVAALALLLPVAAMLIKHRRRSRQRRSSLTDAPPREKGDLIK